LAHKYEWFRGQIYVFFVFGSVFRDGFVAELGKLDSDFVGCDSVWPVSHDGPVTFLWCVSLGSFNYRGATSYYLPHCVGEPAECVDDASSVSICINEVSQGVAE
jgi:hypothetical protein